VDTPNYRNKCYQTKEDKRHNTIFVVGGSETEEERKERLKNLSESRGTWVYDEEKKCMVRKEEYVRKDLDTPSVSKWDDEWTVVTTGRRMSKNELKRYCREKGKIWDN